MSHLDLIRNLQDALSELGEAQERLAGIPEWMAELHEEHSTRRNEIDEVVERQAEADRQRREAEAAAADAEEKLAHYQQQLGQVTTQREYGALLREIDAVRGQAKTAEEAAIEAMEAADEAATEQQKLQDDFQDLDQRYQDELTKWDAEKPEIQQRADKLEKQVAQLREEIPRPRMSLFERIYSKTNGRATAQVIRLQKRGNAMWHCDACNFNVRPQIVVEVQAGKIHQCDSCKRILYWQLESSD